MSGTALVGLDWGISTFRAYRMEADGTVRDSIDAPRGILKVADGDFAGALAHLLDGWAEIPAAVPIVVSGMITSRQGWVETPYLDCPAGAAALAAALVPHETGAGRRLWFVPGLRHHDAAGAPDVMRGEETQLVGCIAGGRPDGLFVLPGSHSKWARVAGGRIAGFTTYMTGEVFAALRDHTILGRLIEPGESADAFDRGVAEGLDAAPQRAGLLHRLFAVRSLGLFERLPGSALADYLSGLLIGSEIREALGVGGPERGTPVVLVGGGALVDRYARALGGAGIQAARAADGIVAAGHAALARAAGLP